MEGGKKGGREGERLSWKEGRRSRIKGIREAAQDRVRGKKDHSCHQRSCKFEWKQYSSGTIQERAFLSPGSKVFSFEPKRFAFDPRKGVLTGCSPHLAGIRLDGEWLDGPQVPLLHARVVKLRQESHRSCCIVLTLATW